MPSERRPRRRWHSALVLSAALWSVATRADPALTEYDVKAGFLYNFATLVDWPAQMPKKLTLCIVGEDPFGKTGASLEGKPVGERTLAVRHMSAGPELRDCQIVFVARSQQDLRPVVAAVGSRTVLTVGDREGVAAQGLVAGFYQDGVRVRFEINVDAVHRAHLPISSRLMNLARIVHDAGPGHE